MITLTHVGFGYKERLFNNLQLSVSPGHICTLLGKNGAGKTTLLKLIAGILPPVEGQCQLFGHEASQREHCTLARLYFVPEEFEVPALTLRQYERLYAPFYASFDHNCFTEALNEFELNLDNILTELSHGNKKKAMLAFAFATKCDLILLDEPTNGLDIPSKQQFRKILANSISDKQSVIISTHQVADIDTITDTLLVVHDSKIVLNESVETISKQISFDYNVAKPDASCLYAEQKMSNYHVIRSYPSETGALDIELLFNALVSGDIRVQAHFTGVNHDEK